MEINALIRYQFLNRDSLVTCRWLIFRWWKTFFLGTSMMCSMKQVIGLVQPLATQFTTAQHFNAKFLLEFSKDSCKIAGLALAFFTTSLSQCHCGGSVGIGLWGRSKRGWREARLRSDITTWALRIMDKTWGSLCMFDGLPTFALLSGLLTGRFMRLLLPLCSLASSPGV